MVESAIQKLLAPTARVLALIAGYGLLGLALLVTTEILLRRFLNFSIQGGVEMGGYVLAILAAFGFSYTLLERGHTRVEILLELAPTRLQAWMNLFSTWCIALMAVFMAWRAGAALSESIEYRSLSGTPLMTPLWQPQSLWLLGLIFFAIVAVVVAVHTASLVIANPRKLNQQYGIKSIDEVISEEKTASLGPTSESETLR